MVYELLQSRNATTTEQRMQVIKEACQTGQLTAYDCTHRKRKR